MQIDCCTVEDPAIAVQHVTYVALQYAACWVLRFLARSCQVHVLCELSQVGQVFRAQVKTAQQAICSQMTDLD